MAGNPRQDLQTIAAMSAIPSNVTVIDHPLVRVKLARLRDESTPSAEFRTVAREIAALLAYAATSNLATVTERIRTPLTECDGAKLEKPIVVVPILRAGLGMVDGMLLILGKATVGHIGMRRDEKTHRPACYYFNVPMPLTEVEVIVVDPMLATGHSASESITRLKAAGAKSLRFICFLSTPEGLAHLASNHPDVPIFTGAVDCGLNERAFIVPGLGDAGDRYFGTPAAG
jgi:uracil phosphoribosyltransferase